MRIDEAAERHWAHLEGLGKLATAKSSRIWLTKFLKFCREHEVRELTGLNAELLAQFRQHLTWTPGTKGQLYSQSTLFQALRLLRLFLQWLHHSALFLADLSQGWRLSRPPDSNRKVPSVEEVSRLLLVPDARTPVGVRNRAILELFYGTGIRSHECFATDIGQLDLKASRLHVRGKGNKDRLLPIGPCLRHSLERYLAIRGTFGAPADEPALFLASKGGQRLGLGSIYLLVKNSALDAKLGCFGPHTLRHAFATHLLENGLDVAYISALLGHESTQSTAIYTRVEPLELFREHQRTHPRAKRKRSKGKRQK